MHNIEFVIYITFNMFTKTQKRQTQNGYERVQSYFHLHISAPKLRIMQVLERNKLRVALKCYKYILMCF
jgi:hypothetical protein